MATELQLDIVTPTSNAYSGRVTQVVVPAWEGQLGVYPDHDAVLALLRGGIATVFTHGGEERFVVGRGFAEIGPDRVTVLTDSFERADAVDKAGAAAELAAAEAELGELDGHSELAETVRARAEIARARVEIQA